MIIKVRSSLLVAWLIYNSYHQVLGDHPVLLQAKFSHPVQPSDFLIDLLLFVQPIS